MRIYLTGGTGYLGGALARRLSADGHEVRALVRESSDTGGLAGLPGVSLHPGDITDRASLREGMSGAEWVIHAAAMVAIDGPSDGMTEVNVGGSENVASLAHKLGVPRFLNVASIACYAGSPADGSLADESAARLPAPSIYSATKRAGEERVNAWAERGLAVNTVYPSLIYGPPGKKMGANFVLRSILKGRFPILVGADKKNSWVYLDDVVEAMVSILDPEKGVEPGRGYLLAGDITTTGDLVREVCRLGGVKPPRLSLPVGLARAALTVAAPLMRLAGKRLPIGPGELQSLSRHWAFDDSRARRELGWTPRPLSEGLPPTVRYIQEQDRTGKTASG